MRQNHNVQVGQVWRSSDPRRLRAIRVESVHAEPRDYPQEAVVTVLYPRPAGSALQRWFEQECGNGNDYGSWCIVRGRKTPRVHGRDPETQASVWTGGEFTHDDDGKPFMEYHSHTGKQDVTYRPLADRETGARRRLAGIIIACNDRRQARMGAAESGDWLPVSAYVQTDPRGAALYIIRPGDVPEGQDVGGYYTRGVCVY